MLDSMRAATQNWIGRSLMALIMGVIVVSFAIFGIGDIFKGFNAGKIAEVGSGEVSADAYRFAYTNDLQQMQRRAGRAVTNDEARAMGFDQQVLGKLVSEAALDQKVKALGLAISDAAVAKLIADDPTFKGPGGQFDQARFQELLRDNGFSERSFVQQQRAVYLRQQIAEAIAGKVPAPLTLLSAIHRYGDETRSIDYFLLTPAAIGELPAPDDKTLEAFFDDRKSAFAAPEFRKIVTLAVTPDLLARASDVSDADAMKLYDSVKAARYTTPEQRDVQQIVFPNEAEATAASEKMKSGTTFDQILTDRKLSPADADLGLVKRGDIGEPAIADAAFSLPLNGVSPPIKNQFGAAIVRVTKIAPSETQPFDKVSAALKNEIARDNARKAVRALHDKIEDARSTGKSLTESAKAAGLDARTIDAIDINGRGKDFKPVPDLIGGKDLIKAAFASDVGVDNDTVSTSDDGYVWFEVAAIEPAHQRTLDEVRPAVVEAWKNDETQKRLADKGKELVKDIQNGGDFAKIAAAQKADVKHDNNVKRAGAEGLSPSAVVQIFDVTDGGAGSASAPGGRVVFHVLDSVVPAFDPDKPDAKAVAEQLRPALEQDILAQYVTKLEADAGVKVNQAALRAASGGAAEQ